MFGLKEPYCLPNTATNLTLPSDKIYQGRKIIKVKYVLLSIWNKTKFQKRIFFSGSAFTPLSGPTTKFVVVFVFAASLSNLEFQQL